MSKNNNIQGSLVRAKQIVASTHPVIAWYRVDARNKCVVPKMNIESFATYGRISNNKSGNVSTPELIYCSVMNGGARAVERPRGWGLHVGVAEDTHHLVQDFIVYLFELNEDGTLKDENASDAVVAINSVPEEFLHTSFIMENIEFTNDTIYTAQEPEIIRKVEREATVIDLADEDDPIAAYDRAMRMISRSG